MAFGLAVGDILGISALACDLHQLYSIGHSRSRLSNCLSNFDDELKALQESMASAGLELQKERASSDAEDSLINPMDSRCPWKQQVYFHTSNDCTASCECQILVKRSPY